MSADIKSLNNSKEKEKFILDKGAIFARFNPRQKKLLENMREYYTVLFCGDGANGSGALGNADVGVALAQNEASLASSFTSSTISCVPKLIKERRCCYVTSVARFKFIISSYIISYFCLVFMVMRGYFLSDLQTLHNDIFVILPLVYCLSAFLPAETLSKERPSARLFHNNMGFWASLAIQVGILGLLSLRSPVYFEAKVKEQSVAATIIFFVSGFQVLYNALHLANCVPHRQPVRQNTRFIFVAVILVLFFVALMVSNILEKPHIVSEGYSFEPLGIMDYVFIFSGILASGLSTVILPSFFDGGNKSQNNKGFYGMKSVDLRSRVQIS